MLFYYKLLIVSIGFFLAAFLTGKNVAITVVKNASVIIITIDTIPNTNMLTPSSFATMLFMVSHNIIDNIIDKRNNN